MFTELIQLFVVLDYHELQIIGKEKDFDMTIYNENVEILYASKLIT